MIWRRIFSSSRSEEEEEADAYWRVEECEQRLWERIMIRRKEEGFGKIDEAIRRGPREGSSSSSSK